MPFNPVPTSNFAVDARTFITNAEGASLIIEDVRDHVPTIGYGYTFIRKDANGFYRVYGKLAEDLNQIDRNLIQLRSQQLQIIANDLNNNRNSAAHIKIESFIELKGPGSIILQD